ncbi:MAG: carboxypeptidase-like regulatory domain-containing protein [Vulcanimicrobiaceae bacterium]
MGFRSRRLFVAAALAGGLAAFAGCVNPNAIGLQQYGEVFGNVVDAGGKPIPGALVSIGSLLAQTTGPDGAFDFKNVPIGEQTVMVSVAGYKSEQAVVDVKENKRVTPGNVMLPNLTATP